MKLNLRDIRKRRHLSQKEMANLVGEKVRTYGSWERGEVVMNVEQLFRCATVLDVSCDEILGHDVPTTFATKREREMHAVYSNLSDEGQERLLHQAIYERSVDEANKRHGEFLRRWDMLAGRS